MSQISYEQENDLSAPVSTGIKMQTNEISRNAKSLKTPSAKNLPSLKKVGDKSSRKAFGNVSNVLRTSAQTSIGGKPEAKGKAPLKASDGSESLIRTEDKKASDVNETEIAAKSTEQTQTETKVDPKYLDEIENMYPIDEEELTDAKWPLTEGLFSIDERLVQEMAFDEDFCEELMPNKKPFDFDQFF